MARRAKVPDKHVLYQLAVQNPEFETRFLRKVYRRERGKDPRRLREDFCGTGLLACEWVRRVPRSQAVGLDLDEATLAWGRAHNVARLGAKAARVRLIRCDVLEACGFRPDIVAAFNFSYFVFKTRARLRAYFQRVRRALAPDGVFFLDIYGGPEAQFVQEESQEVAENGVRFHYVWEQVRYNPVTAETLCHIHFDLPGGRRIRRAFTYDWRLWTLAEVREILDDAGFRKTDVYWEGTDHDTGGGNSVFKLSRRGDDSRSWIAYVVAVK